LASPRNEKEEIRCGDALPAGSSTPDECLSELSLEEAEADADKENISETGQGLCLEIVPGDSPDCGRLLLTTPMAKDSSAIPALAAQIIETLQMEKVEMDNRLRSVLAERDTLLQDRAQLELANMRLCQASLEKDKQLAVLLLSAAAPGASPSRQALAVTPSNVAEKECGGCNRMLQLGRGTEDCPVCQGCRAPKALPSEQ
jgi:hypothetical protein